MDAAIKILKALLEVFKEPLIFYLGMLKGKSDGRSNMELEAKTETLEQVAKAKRIRESGLTPNDVKRLRNKYSRK